ncbi:transcriptional repressor [Candidatus Saccharibacteria bacterium]|nr:transcriptional repressor [Candidatus Saccharibacteria bacterium]
MTPQEATFRGKLRANQQSVTAARLAVFRALCKHETVTMQRLVRSLANSADRASVYRSVALFEQLGIVQRIQVGWKYQLELSDNYNPHHHHIHCSECGRLSALPEVTALEEMIKKIARNAGYSLTSHQLELTGRCSKCSHKK